MRIITKRLVSAFLAMSCTHVLASGYIGAGVGTVFPDIPEFGSTTGVELIAGVISQEHAIEISYINFGDSSSGGITVSNTGFTLGVLTSVPIDENDDLFFKIGGMNWNASGLDSMVNVETSGTDIFFGIGLNSKLENNLSISIRYNIYAVDEFNPSMLSAYFQYGF